ncbi:MAG: O-antigen ligase family protein [Actinobacteria bacterium]|nr:O-antigen ligase family protein [Actinomycetota bacterium]
MIFVFLVRYLGFENKLFGSLINYMTGGYYFSIAILLILEVNLIEIIKKRFLIILISLDILILIILSVLENVRGNWIAIAAAIIFSFILAKNKKKFLIYALILLLILVILFIIAGFIKPQLFENTLNEIKSLKSFFLNDTGDNQNVAVVNTNWRTITWKGFLKEYLKRPVFGWGFGRKFLPGETSDMGWNTGLADNWVATHNYIISFLYISGIVGLLIFGFIIASFFRENIRFLRSSFPNKDWYLVRSFLCCMVYILVLGLFEVVMEIPYQGVFFWVFFGFNILIIKNFFSGKNKNITSEKDVRKN